MSVYVAAQPLPLFVGTGRDRTADRIPPVVSSGPWRAFDSASPPTVGNDFSPVTLGVEFYVTSAVNLTEIRWWQVTTGELDVTNARQAGLFTLDGTQVVATVTGPAPGLAGSGWQTITLPSPFALTPSTRYRAGVYFPFSAYPATGSYFTALPDITNGPLVVVGAPNATNNKQGTFNYTSGISFPDTEFNSGNYWIDVTVAT